MAVSTRSYDEYINPSQVALWVSETINAQNFQIAVVVVLSYDIMITMDKEIRYFWKIPRKAVDFIYFTNRYVGLFGAIARLFWNTSNPGVGLCNYSQWARNISNWITIILIDYILMIRVLALYSQDTRLFKQLGSLLVVDAVLKLGMVIYLDVSQNVTISYLPGNIAVCNIGDPPAWQWGVVDWSIPIVYGVILVLVALYKVAEYWKLSSRFRELKVMKILVRDQILYCLLVIVICTLSIMSVLLRFSSEIASTILGRLGVPSFLSVLGSRLLFNLKEAGDQGQYDETSLRTQSRTVSNIVFADLGDIQRSTDTETVD